MYEHVRTSFLVNIHSKNLLRGCVSIATAVMHSTISVVLYTLVCNNKHLLTSVEVASGGYLPSREAAG